MNNSQTANRLKSLDALRGIAVILMVQQHLGYWLWDMDRKTVSMYDMLQSHPLFVVFNGLGGIAAPLFIFLAGCGTVFLKKKNDNSNRIFFIRGVAIILFGYMLNIAVPSWFSPGSWYVLHLIGFAYALSPLLLKLKTDILAVLSVLVLAVSVMLQYYFETPFVLSNDRMSNYYLPGGLLRLAFFEGHFPIFPWMIFFLSGIAAGRWITEKKTKYLFYSGIVCFAFAVIIVTVPKFQGIDYNVSSFFKRAFSLSFNIYPALPPLVIVLLGISFSMTALSIKIEEVFPSIVDNPLIYLGRSSLTILIVHTIFFRNLTRTARLAQSFNADMTAILIIIVMLIFTLLAVIWQKFNYRFGFEWLIRKLSS